LLEDEFIRRVAEHVGRRDLETVEVATRVTLDSLAVQLNDGCRRALAAQLPDGLAASMRSVMGQEGGRATPLGVLLDRLDECVPGCASQEDAGRTANAVFTTLREVLPARRYMLTVEQLPDEYGEIIA
jgi:uncharacterized protein (DUF2267 family)